MKPSHRSAAKSKKRSGASSGVKRAVRGLAAGALLMTAGAASAAEPADAIAALRDLKIENGTITSVQHDDSPTMVTQEKQTIKNVPARTIIKVVLNPAKGSNINVEIWLPDAQQWNGRLLGLGNGGAAGHINPTSFIWPLQSKYAVVTTDMGTAPNPDSGNGNPEVWKDFGFRATHLMTVVAKQAVKTYYGKAPEFSYFTGGSTGGQQAMQEAQRYPEDYDGIVANIAAHCRTPLHAYFLWNDQILKKCPFNESQQKAVVEAGNEYMAPREVPAIAGQFISDPRCTSQDIEAVIALAMKKDPTLTPAHADALRKLFDGPRHAITGERIFNGIPFGSSLDSAHGHLYLFHWVFGAKKNLQQIDFGKDMDTYTVALAPYLNAENPDLSAFKKRGGKLIMVMGAADSVVPYHASIDYYERVIGHFGSLDQVQSFYKMYIIPGMAHGGGPGVANLPNALDIVAKWREKGVEPQAIPAKKMVNGKTVIEMPIYPYPAKTAWDAASKSYKAVEGPRGGVDPIAERFRPAAAE